MQQLLTILHILIAICVIILVLIQHGKGADIGANFGSGASQTMFGSQGSTPFLVKLTGGLALLFFVTSAVLSFVVGKQSHHGVGVPIPTVVMPQPATEQIPTSNNK
jgi:preprotein translocase subunit SecG